MHRAKSCAALNVADDRTHDSVSALARHASILPSVPLAQEVLGSRRQTSFSASACASGHGIRSSSSETEPPQARRHSSKLLKLKGLFEKIKSRLPSRGSDSAPVSPHQHFALPTSTCSSPHSARGQVAQHDSPFNALLPGLTTMIAPSSVSLALDTMGLFSSSIFGSDASPAKSPGAFQSNSEGYDTLMSSYGGGALLTRTLHSPGPTPPPQRKLSHLSQASPCVHGTSWDGRPTGLAAPLSSAAGTPMASLSAAGASTGAGAVSPLPRSSGGDRPLPPMPMPPAAIPRSPPTVLSTERLIALLPHNRDGSVAAARSGSIPLQQPASPSSSPRPYPPATLGAALSATAAATIHTPSGGTLRASNSVRRALRAFSSNLETADAEPVALVRGARGAGAGSVCVGGSGQGQDTSCALKPESETSRRSTDDGIAPSSLLLAASPALPSAMSRPVWSLEDYTISRRLYKGSSSAVYKATCNRSGLPVALKVYWLNKLPANCVHMLKREIEVHMQLVHKHIARLYAAFAERSAPGSSAPSTKVVLVQEYAARGDLFDVHERLGGRMKPTHVVTLILKPLLEALAHMHSQGILHRDIKPANVLFTTDWRLLVADFGVSINLHQERAVTRAGTEGYMAPEVERCPLKAEPQENKDKPQLAYSTAVDIWAVGCMAYELMVGFPPAITPQNQDAQANSDIAAVQFPLMVPQEARSFIRSALSPDPSARPTAAQLLASKWLQSGGD